jgi:TctA family transporter
VKISGETAAVVTGLDGHQMAEQGKARVGLRPWALSSPGSTPTIVPTMHPMKQKKTFCSVKPR